MVNQLMCCSDFSNLPIVEISFVFVANIDFSLRLAGAIVILVPDGITHDFSLLKIYIWAISHFALQISAWAIKRSVDDYYLFV